MSDLYQQLTNSPIGKKVTGLLGLPAPTPLRRYEPGQPLLPGPLLLGGARGGRLRKPARTTAERAGADVVVDVDAVDGRLGAAVFDATGITTTAQLTECYEFFHAAIRRMGPHARAVVLATPPADAGSVEEATVQRSLVGFVKSLGKELRAGGTAQLLQVAPQAEEAVAGPLRFILSARSAYVSGQVLHVGPTPSGATTAKDPATPLDGKVAVVTGAARGIGAAIAETLSRQGAHVVVLDLPSQGAALTDVANRIGGESLQLDITADDAPQALATHLADRHGGLDVIVHNAGITRDKTLAGMDVSRWQSVIEINLAAQARLDAALLDKGVLNDQGRIIGVSSIAGIAGNRGQTNYGTSKAGVIGRVEAMAPQVADRGITVNAVAPGFIETEMTAQIPLALREVSRRLNSMSQGGQPVDVAEAIAFFAEPDSSGVTGQVLRVCGQSLLGA